VHWCGEERSYINSPLVNESAHEMWAAAVETILHDINKPCEKETDDYSAVVVLKG